MSMRGVPAALLFVASLPFPTEIVIFRLLECIFFRPEKWRLMNSALVRVVASFAWRTTALPFRKWKNIRPCSRLISSSRILEFIRIPDSGEVLKKMATAAGKTTSWMSVMAPDGHKLRIFFFFFFDQQTDRCVDAFAFHLWSLLLRIQSLHNKKKKNQQQKHGEKRRKLLNAARC